MQQTDTPPRPTLDQAVRHALHERGRTGYYKDLNGDRLEPYSWAGGEAAQITGADPGTAEHTAVWTVLVAAGMMGGPLVGRPGSKVGLVDSVTAAVGSNPFRSSHICAVRLKQVCNRILAPNSIDTTPGLVVRLCQSLSTQVEDRRLPDPLVLAADLTKAFHPDTRRELVLGWQARAVRAR